MFLYRQIFDIIKLYKIKKPKDYIFSPYRYISQIISCCFLHGKKDSYGEDVSIAIMAKDSCAFVKVSFFTNFHNSAVEAQFKLGIVAPFYFNSNKEFSTIMTPSVFNIKK